MLAFLFPWLVNCAVEPRTIYSSNTYTVFKVKGKKNPLHENNFQIN